MLGKKKKKRNERKIKKIILAKHKSEPPGLVLASLSLTVMLPYFPLWERKGLRGF